MNLVEPTEIEQTCIDQGLLSFYDESRTHVFPTLLGLWRINVGMN